MVHWWVLLQTYLSLILLFHPSQFEKWCKLGKHCCNKTPRKKRRTGEWNFAVSKFCQVLIKTLILLSSPIKVVSSWMLKPLILLSSPIKALPSWMLKTLIVLLKTDNKRIWKECWLKSSSMTRRKLWRNLVTRFWKKKKRNFARKLDQTWLSAVFFFSFSFSFSGGWFSILWCNQTGEWQQEDLTKFGYKPYTNVIF